MPAEISALQPRNKLQLNIHSKIFHNITVFAVFLIK